MLLTHPNNIVYQFNLNHCRAAVAEVKRITSTMSSFVFAIQEPYLNYRTGQVALLDNRHSIISVGLSPRAIIYAHKNNKLWPQPQLMSRDVAAAIWHRPVKGCSRNVLFLSVYWDIDLPLPVEFTNALDFAKEIN